MEPKNLKRWLILIAILYLVFPRDLIPDFLGRGLGWIDDLLVMALLVYFYRRSLREYAAPATHRSRRQNQRERMHRGQAQAPEDSFDPHDVLGIPASASQETIQTAYRARMQEYHPDKVAHLGEELQKLAHRKTLEIQRAYQQLNK
jgi:uncharacterized membrane protein YkvA (DUF1232 family)